MTKYFCIGLQRTGTTSLHQAALSLGIRSAPMSADLLYNLEAPLIDQHDLFSDNPIPLLYQKLDKAYPNSKFILTTRPIEVWLKSVDWLLTHDKPTLSPELQEIGDDIHQRLYGRTTFDELVFRAFWHSYHAEVDSYFANRPGDLLRLNFSAGDGWEKLCPFVDKPIPNEPFPHTNQRRKKSWWQQLLF